MPRRPQSGGGRPLPPRQRPSPDQVQPRPRRNYSNGARRDFLDGRRDPATYDPPEENIRVTSARYALEWIAIIGAAVAIAFGGQALFLQPFLIPSGSMEPTLEERDRILVNKFGYGLEDIDRGEIIVFDAPPTETNPEVNILVKRVIGLPGETIESRNGFVYINGEPIEEEYLPQGSITSNIPRTVVPEDELYMLGDNRNNSEDSRVIGTIPTDLIIGETIFKIWPLNDLEIF